MKTKFLFILIFLFTIFWGCDDTSTEPDPVEERMVDKVEVTQIWTETLIDSVQLSREVMIPVNLVDAVFILEECYAAYDESSGVPILTNRKWVYSNIDYVNGQQFINYYLVVGQNTADVTITR